MTHKNCVSVHYCCSYNELSKKLGPLCPSRRRQISDGNRKSAGNVEIERRKVKTSRIYRNALNKKDTSIFYRWFLLTLLCNVFMFSLSSPISLKQSQTSKEIFLQFIRCVIFFELLRVKAPFTTSKSFKRRRQM